MYYAKKRMISEKLKNIFQGKHKIENLVVFLILLIIVVIAINYIMHGNKKTTKQDLNNIDNNEIVQVSSNTKNEENIEIKLEKILSKISGVGNVKVMITYAESSTLLPVYNEDSKESNTTESDTGGGTRTISEVNNQKEIIYKENSDGTKEPVTQSVVSPKIEGAIITATGAGNAEVKSNIVQAVEAATGLLAHKIQVFKMVEEN